MGETDPPVRETSQALGPASDRTAPVSLRPKPVRRTVVHLDGKHPLLDLLGPSLSPVKLSSSDVMYFDMSRHYVLQDMRRWSFVGRFDQHVLRQAMHDECIRHAILALSAMCKETQGLHADHQPGSPKWVLTAREFVSGEHGLRLNAGGRHYRAALAHYVEATELCRQKLARLDESTLPTVIIATYIFTVLEMLQGNVEAMSRLLSHNDALLKLGKKAGKSAGFLQGDAADINTELGDMFHHLSIKCALFPFYNDQRFLYQDLAPAEIWPVPTDETPFELVRKAWEKTIRPIQKYFISLPFVTTKGPAAMEECTKQQVAYVTQARQWVLMVNRRLRAGPEPRARQELRAMKVDILITLVFLECSLDPAGLLWDTKIKEFQEASELLEKLARDTSSKHIKFLYEFRVIPTVALLVTKCRDRAVRQHALDMLVELMSRDTRWSGVILVKALQTIIDLEEERRNEEGLIPVSDRYDWIASQWDFDSNRLAMKLKVGEGLPLSGTPPAFIDLVIQV